MRRKRMNNKTAKSFFEDSTKYVLLEGLQGTSKSGKALYTYYGPVALSICILGSLPAKHNSDASRGLRDNAVLAPWWATKGQGVEKTLDEWDDAGFIEGKLSNSQLA